MLAHCEDVKLMKDTVGNALEVKASGGVRNLEDFNKMIEKNHQIRNKTKTQKLKWTEFGIKK